MIGQERVNRSIARKKLDQLRKEAQQEVLSVLTEAQRDKLEDLLGEEFEFTPPSPMSLPVPAAPGAPVKKRP